MEGLTTFYHSNKSYALSSSKSLSIVNSKFNPLSTFSQCTVANAMLSFDVNSFKFNKDVKVALFTHPVKSFNCNVMYK